MNGERLLTIAAEHIGEAYFLGALAPKNNPNWNGPWDCAEFVSWCVFQAGGILYGCNNNSGNPARADAYTGFWARDANSIGQRISVSEAGRTPGAAVLRVARGDRIGHIVLSDGQGGTIEAKSRIDRVRRDTLSHRRWDMGILVPGITYAPNAGPVDITVPNRIFRITSPFMRGETVRRIQVKLKQLDIDPGPIDGIYGPQTVAAVYAFQQMKGLVTDGEVGPETARALEIDIF